MSKNAGSFLNEENGEVVYRETFNQGPGAWTQGKNHENGSWHRNVFGQKGEGLALEWSSAGGRTGGYAYTESPWYFDDNHGEFMWFHMPMTARSDMADENGIGDIIASGRVPDKDLRDAILRITLRGKNLELNGTRLMPWIQGWGGRHGNLYAPGNPLFCWGLASQSASKELLDNGWHEVAFKLTDDEEQWRSFGLINGGLTRKLRVVQSLTVATGTLPHILDGHYYCIGFILGPLDPNNLPSGRIEVDEISITLRPANIIKPLSLAPSTIYATTNHPKV